MEVKIYISDELLRMQDESTINRAIDAELKAVKRSIINYRQNELNK